MVKIEVLGTGCPKCKKTIANVERAVFELGLDAEVIKVDDINAIVERGVIFTPALVIDGEVKVDGRVPSVEIIKELISKKEEK